MATGRSQHTGTFTSRAAAMAAALLTALAAQATVRHVDYSTGTDSGDGDAGAPWKTLAYAASNANAGDEIVLASGTHTISSDITIDKALTIHGTGAMDDTVVDANHVKCTIFISGDGATISNLQFYRLGGISNHAGYLQLQGDSTISGCRFTGCGSSAKNSPTLIYAYKGLISGCYFTDNEGPGCMGICFQGGSTTVAENCLFTRNTIRYGATNGGTGLGILHLRSNDAIVRNCTIVSNTVQDYAAVYGPYWSGTGNRHGQLYNCIAYDNCNENGVQKNWYAQFGSNETSMWSGNVFDTLKDSGNHQIYAADGNLAANPLLDAECKPTLMSPQAVKHGAVDGATRLTSTDILGVSRGREPSRGVYQYVADRFSTAIVASDTEKRLPETITLSLIVEGAASTNLTYAWDIDGDGTTDGTGPTYTLDAVGTYDSIGVTVGDGTSTATATYDRTLTVLQEYLVVSIVPNGTAVRYPSNLVFRAEVANAYEGQLTYSWDTDGDGVADSTSSNIVYSTPGFHAAPTLLAIADQNGRRKENVTLAGAFYIHPAEAVTYYVDYANGSDAADGTAAHPWKTLAFAASCDYTDNGDEIVLKRGTHRVSSAVNVAKALRIHGEGEKEETILDANNTNPKFVISAAGAYVNNLTFYRFGGNYAIELVKLTGNSVVSNVVVTACSSSSSSPGVMFLLSAGLLTHSWITNNVASYNAGVEMRGNSTLENCAILNNRSTHSNFDQGAALRIPHGTGTKIVRNCTIAGNTFAKSGNAALYGYAWETAKERVYLYNNIVWDNTCTADGSVRNANNASSQKWIVKNNCWDFNTASKIQDPAGGTDFGSVLTDPLFDATLGAPWLSSASPCKNTGSDEYGTLASTDILGASRRSDTHIEIGCVECQPAGFTAAIWASAAEARLPATITLSVVVEGTDAENLTYAWDIDGDGTVDGTGPTYTLDEVGAYDSVSVTVSDGSDTATDTYAGTLTILAEHLAVSIVANGPVVRYPSNLVFRAEIANAYVGPLTYSWDTDGDGVADSSSATVAYSAVGVYAAPTLLSIVDSNGKRNDNVTLAGVFTIHTVEDQTYYVDYTNGDDAADGTAAHPWKTLAFAVSRPFLDDGDEIVLKRGTHRVSDAVNMAKALRVHGEGEKEETILDANNANPGFTISANGARVNNLTFYRFGHTYNQGQVKLNGDSVISNVVVTGATTGGSGGTMITMKAGLLTHSWITNNVAGYSAGVEMDGDSTMENCAILGNHSTSVNQYLATGVALRFPHGTGRKTVRNCTIAYNTFAYTNNTAIYAYVWDTGKEQVQFHNNIVWGNSCTANGVVRNLNQAAPQKWFVKNNCWDYTNPARIQDPEGGTDFGSVLADPLFNTAKGGAPVLSNDSPCRNAGSDEYGSQAALDLLGSPRRSGKHIDIGCMESLPAGLRLYLR